MLRLRCRPVGLAVLMLGAAPPALLAEPLIDNLAEPIRDVTVLGVTEPDSVWAAQSFTTPRRVGLDTISLMVGRLVDSPVIVSELRTGPEPTGPLLATLVQPAISAGEVEPAVFVPDAAVVLEPGSVYWIVMYTLEGGSFGWAYADNNEWIGDGALADYWYSYDAGGLWASYGSDFPYMVGIEVTPIVCAADLNGDGLVDFSDYLEFLNLYDAADPRADFNMDGLIDFSDYLEFLNLYDAGC